MKWETAREHFPNQWVIMEATDTHYEPGRRIIEDMSVIDAEFKEMELMRVYQEWLRKMPDREIFFFHTSRETIDIESKFRIFPRPRREVKSLTD